MVSCFIVLSAYGLCSYGCIVTRLALIDILIEEAVHLFNDPMNIGFSCFETRDACAHDWNTVNRGFGHPRDLILAKRREELSSVQTFAREAEERQRSVIDDLPSRSEKRLFQHTAHAGLVLDHCNLARFAVMRQGQKKLET